MTRYFSELVEQSVSRAKEASLSILGITNPALRNHLNQLMGSECGDGQAFLAPPVFEHTFGWEFADRKIEELSGDLLSSAVVKALDDESNGRYRFKASFSPFKHQLKAWSTLLSDTPQSVIVTSGTGSGKTECFMVPVLEDLYREYHVSQQPLVGVRALFLYPLNALINSQQERLDAWTKHFKGGIRYCLYNGNTENNEGKVRKEQQLRPNEVLSRELMRKSPAPVLVTNGTMLEYMLVRQIDSPIIEISKQQKSLRWIVLDEAHTYVGSQAAELALQLRRVLQAFGVEAKNVRFVATSATIAGEDANEQLRQYLSELAGVNPEQIKVIGGRRIIPELDFAEEQSLSLTELESIEPLGQPVSKGKADPQISESRYNALLASSYARMLRSVVVEAKKPQTINEICERLAKCLNIAKPEQVELLRWLDLLTGTKPDEETEAFLKVRAHFFQRMTNGLWCCIDKSCACKVGTPLEHDWPFGYVYATQTQKCECGAPVFELTFCSECNEPHLMARDKGGKFVQWHNNAGDEFSLQHESGDEDSSVQDLDESVTVPAIFTANPDAKGVYQDFCIGKNGEAGSFDSDGYMVGYDVGAAQVCSRCEFGGYQNGSPFRRAMLGAPFYIANVVPTLLEFCPDFDDKGSEGPQSLPARGRRLITFTDSRQGTARLSVRMQQEAERSKLRGAVVEVLKEAQLDQPVDSNKPADGVSADDLRTQANVLRGMGLEDSARELESRATAMEAGSPLQKFAVVVWKDMARALARKSDFQGSMILYNQYMSPEVFKDTDGSYKLAEMLLFREFARRPKRQNNSETQGLVKVGYAGLEKVIQCPEYWEDHSLTLADWQDFIKVALDFYVRENNFMQVENKGWLKWVGSKFSSKSLRSPSSEEHDEGRIKRWPQMKQGNMNRLVKLLCIAADIKPENGKDIVNGWLKAAWMDLTEKARILVPDQNRFALDREKLTFSFIDKAYICPVTNKLLDTTLKGITPYLPRTIADTKSLLCESVEFPAIWQFDSKQLDFQKGLHHVRELVFEDSSVKALRARNLWTDINDRAVEGGLYYRTAEHSAQQSAERLDEYESMFKAGKINVLNCSTTMEMGVDIGGISAVVMNNVPPHPANYLQRAGRAGRSKESRAISYTLCKGNPHDQQVFVNPKWPFETRIPAPYVAFNSERLVQRHVNSMLLSLFLREVIGQTSTEKTSLNLEWFYLPAESSVCQRFIAWLNDGAETLDSALRSLVRETVLMGSKPEQLRDNAEAVIVKLQQQWLSEYHYLETEMTSAIPDSPYAYRLKVEQTRLGKEYLLRELASKSFLPGYGFPTDVVNFDNNNIEDFIRNRRDNSKPKEDREDNVSRYRGLPSRNLAVAIREYAPGAEIVLDGRVFRSGGVALHWHNVNDSGPKEAQKFDFAWRCDCCGQTGYEEDVASSELNMRCSNPSCNQPIKGKHIRKVLQPTGFVTDFYVSPTNDVSTQKFIPVEPAWVSAGKAPQAALPNMHMGYMVSSTEGTVFNHTSGVNGKGYALCMSCGRAESLDKNGDYPNELSPTKSHQPLRAPKSDARGDTRSECDGSGTLIQGVHLGCHAKTDVFELVLNHPVRNEYINDDPEGRVVATTLAVALRAALAEKLGISTSELGYAIRPAIVEGGLSANVIQLYDMIAGGAGFASSANIHIQSLISGMVSKLECDKCVNGCGDCLLEADTRHDVDNIDRLAAKGWLGHDFLNYNGLPPELAVFQDTTYHPFSVAQVIRNQIHKGAEKLVFALGADIDSWDLTNPNFKRNIAGYLAVNNFAVTIVAPTDDLTKELKEELWVLQQMGVEIAVGRSNHQYVVAQVIKGSTVMTIASSNADNGLPGCDWLKTEGVVFSSVAEPLMETTPLSTVVSADTDINIRDTVEITSELNGSLSKFGERFWLKLINHDKKLVSLLSNSRIKRVTYSDRYIQSPSSMLMITEVLAAICKVKPDIEALVVETLFHEKDKLGNYLHHDWQDKEEFAQAYQVWIQLKTGIEPEFHCTEIRSQIAHGRKLSFEFSSGDSIDVRLDQGVGYWMLKRVNSTYSAVKYDFMSDLSSQLAELQRSEGEFMVVNSGEWPTDVSYKYYSSNK